jgi:hypothetical protein
MHARPWTALANDDLVSELLSSFFASDGCFYLSFVGQQHFLDDMEAGDIEIVGIDYFIVLLSSYVRTGSIYIATSLSRRFYKRLYL